ncbi:helix-turn-helix domain-containing protein [Lihuaxuella thermophila]|uniref:Helix-turn-helix n=1 Tax=Lihuaxuella thermophila TaxID=1173111 RepID=A0A1H8J194_9BACL|nr:helix-turn-helix transcriptional regulator [Lihuaxuella thermophila]SEN74750.1 Helix-turn-helix [Lihuaxuella thermophila]
MKNVSLDDEIARYVVRRRRIKEKNLTLEDMEDLNISKGTLSNIENGKSVREDYFNRYLKKIDMKKSELDKLVQEVTEEVKDG